MPIPKELRDLMERYNQLGRLLPRGDDIAMDVEGPRVLAEAEIILGEMTKVKLEIDDFIAAARQRRP